MIYKSLKLELFKIKHRFFYLTWFLMTAAPLAYELYHVKDLAFSERYLFSNTELYYYFTQAQIVELLSLFLPIMASVLISKICDSEHKADTWKLLLTSNQSFESLWTIKFLLVYFFMELTTILFYLLVSVRVFMVTGASIPIIPLLNSFLGISGANLITLTLAEILAVKFKNQVIVLVEGLLGGFIGIISSLLPPFIIYFLPWGYYALNILAGNRPAGYDQSGLVIWDIYATSPNYLVIYGISILFILINIVACRMLSREEQ